MKPASVAIAIFLSSGLALPLAAQAQTAPPAAFIDRLDRDGDGIVSREEIGAAREHLFGRLDANSDGNLDAGEIEALRDAIMDRAVALQARLGSQWRRMDANGDGKVSVEEFRSRTLLFDLADRDGDNRISPAEFAVIRGILTGHPG